MNPDMILGIIHNIALLIAVSLLGGYYWGKEPGQLTFSDKLLTGMFLGATGMVIMLTPWILVPGLVFDTRSVLLSVSGLFFGSIPTLTAILITGAYRIILGGDGLWMGLAVIFSSGIIGILFRKFRPGKIEKKPIRELIFLGLTVHLAMLVCTLLLPTGSFLPTLKTIALPVLTIYPVGTIFFGLLMRTRIQHYQTKRNLHRSEEKFRQLFQKTDVIMMLVDPETGHIIDANESSARFYGYSIGEIIKKTITEINTLPPEEVAEIRRKALKEESKYFELVHRLANGEFRTVEVHASPIIFHNQTVLFSIIHDITERKKTEKALLEAKERAEESDRLKSTFLATMSHELRTPLNAVIGFSDLLCEDPDMSNVRRFARTIHNSGKQLLSIIESIFDIALLQSRESKIHLTKIPIRELFSNIGHYITVELKRKNKMHLRINFHPDPENPDIHIRSDHVKLTQLLSNLLNNAIKYTGEGSIDYGYNLTGDDLVFFVKDTGIGIPASKIDIIFKLFTQGDDSHVRFHGGVGLGLAICKEIANVLNGDIWVESEEGKGSTFYFKLHHAVEKENPGQDSDRIRETIPDLSGKTVLIVDDMIDNILLLTNLLKETKANILSAENGDKAIHLVKETLAIDVILMDIKMPGLNGYETTKAIHSFRPEIPVMAQTAYVFEGDKEQALEAGCIGHLSKPIQKGPLFSSLRAALSRSFT